MDIDSLLALEMAVWRALVDGDADADVTLLADDFTGVYPTGFATRADHVSQLADGPTLRCFDLTEVRSIVVSDDAALLLYRAEYERVDGDASDPMYVSSLWVRRGTGWVNVFSQDTPASGVAVV